MDEREPRDRTQVRQFRFRAGFQERPGQGSRPSYEDAWGSGVESITPPSERPDSTTQKVKRKTTSLPHTGNLERFLSVSVPRF